jgi:hypothetical protein
LDQGFWFEEGEGTDIDVDVAEKADSKDDVWEEVAGTSR